MPRDDIYIQLRSPLARRVLSAGFLGALGALVASMYGATPARAVPMAPELMPAKIELPGELAAYTIAVDSQDPHIYDDTYSLRSAPSVPVVEVETRRVVEAFSI